MRGFFSVIDFIKNAEKLDDTVAISMKTLDPRLYKLADGSYNYTKIKNTINTYAAKLRDADMYIDGVTVSNRQLDLVVPKGYSNVIDEIPEKVGKIDIDGIVFNLQEL